MRNGPPTHGLGSSAKGRPGGTAASTAWLFACLLALAGAAACLADGWSDTPEREVTLPSGRKLAYAYHFSRNDIRESCRVGDSIIVLTRPGDLLRFQIPGYRLTHQGIASPQAVCLGHGAGEEVRGRFAGAKTQPKQVYDAIAWDSGQFLLATDLGALAHDVGADSLSRPPFAAPTGKVRALCRDGLGRVWLAGDGLWVTDPATRVVRDVRAAVPIAPSDIASLAADPDRKDAVIAPLGQRGALFLRAEEAPAR